MNEQPFGVGDEVTATVTQVAPFGVLVVSADVAGLLAGVSSDAGTELRVRVTAFDATAQRFAAELV